MKLTATKVRSISEPGKYIDQHGLILRVAPGGSKQWVWRGTIHGKRTDIGLGAVAYTPLAEAREIAFEYRRISRRGGDPRSTRTNSGVPTFNEAVEAVIDAHRGGWKNGRSETNWRRPLTYAVSLGRVPVDQITTSDLARVLRPVWHDKPETARKLRTRLGMVMRWAIAEGHRTADPAGPALTAALPRHTVPPKHHRSLPHGEIAEALRIVDGSARAWPVSKSCLRFIVATACRSGEARLARWDEIDRDAETWTVPGERSKTQPSHIVPLSKMALAALAEAHSYADGSGPVRALPASGPTRTPNRRLARQHRGGMARRAVRLGGRVVTEADFKISLARRSSRFSRSRRLSRSRSSLVNPGRRPESTSIRRTHSRTVSGVGPSFSATDEIASHCEPQCLWPQRPSAPPAHASHRGTSPGVACSVMAPSSQGSEPAQYPVRFKHPSWPRQRSDLNKRDPRPSQMCSDAISNVQYRLGSA